MGQHWTHVALAAASRFIIDVRLGARTLESAAQLVASVALACRSAVGGLPLLLIDDHRPYPAAILQVFGLIRHRRRKRGRGRLKHPDLKPPPGLLVGVVKKTRDERGNLLGVTTKVLFGSRKAIVRRIRRAEVGEKLRGIEPFILQRLHLFVVSIHPHTTGNDLAPKTNEVERNGICWIVWISHGVKRPFRCWIFCHEDKSTLVMLRPPHRGQPPLPRW